MRLKRVAAFLLIMLTVLACAACTQKPAAPKSCVEIAEAVLSGQPFDEMTPLNQNQTVVCRCLPRTFMTFKRMAGLTGTPASNGLMDLWAQFRLLDMGQRLGRYIGVYRDQYFIPDKRDGMVIFNYKPKPGAEEAIYKRIGDITISMKSADFLCLPECVMNEIPVRLSTKELTILDDMRKNLIASVKGEMITAVNAAVLSNKLLQMANGAIYTDDGKTIQMGVVMIEGLSPDQPTVTNDAGGKQSELPYAFDMLPPQAVFALARVVAEGERKYGSDNWKKIPARQHLNHAIAHCFAFLAGDNTDSHLGHAITRLAFAIELAENRDADHAT
ncbi:hypothetical protein AGMMS49992_01220 [Clostridia bacterium]|nr:hypothetical protein AGMMS49992_01220 [Clostridia bacterium]